VTLLHLRSFVVLADLLNFGRASRALRISQPSLSRQIQRLERAIGVQLFDRSRHRIDLTAEGHVFLTHARHLLAVALEVTAAARRLKHGKFKP